MGARGITGNRDTGITGISTGITGRHCNCMFHAARWGWCWIMDPVQTALMKRYCYSEHRLSKPFFLARNMIR